MTEQDKALLREWLADAQEKERALPARIKAEAEAAKQERRKPYQITPHTEVSPGPMLAAIESIENIPDNVAPFVGTARNTCETLGLPFSMRCDQIIAILSLPNLD